MNIAVIIAGGKGLRAGFSVPKQYVRIGDRSVLLHTLTAFQKCSCIDAIEVVCGKEWEEEIWKETERCGIEKLRWTVHGGNNCQQSIKAGIDFLNEKAEPEDIVIIHDGVRPLVSEDIIVDAIRVCEKHGNGISASVIKSQIFVAEKGCPVSTVRCIPRGRLREVATPQAYRLDFLYRAYQEAFAKGMEFRDDSYTNTMVVALGERLYFSRGSSRNLKLTTQEDLEIIRCLLKTVIIRGENVW